MFVARIVSGRTIRSSSAKSSSFGAEILDDRLDDEIAVGEVGEIGRQRERRERRLALVRGHLLLVDLALEEVRDPLARRRAELVRHLAADRLVAGLDRQLRDPGAHRAEADDADAPDLRSGHDRRDPSGARQARIATRLSR